MLTDVLLIVLGLIALLLLMALLLNPPEALVKRYFKIGSKDRRNGSKPDGPSGNP